MSHGESTRGASGPSGRALFGGAFLVLLAFGGLMGRQTGTLVGAVAVAAGLAAIGELGLALLLLLLTLANRAWCAQHPAGAMTGAVARGAAWVLPFLVLAFAADLVLGWQAVMSFGVAGLMSLPAGVSSELGRLGSRRAANMLLPALFALLIAAGWLLWANLVRAGWGG